MNVCSSFQHWCAKTFVFSFQRLVSIMCHIMEIIIDCNHVYFLKFVNGGSEK
jgi:hypothetical protein